MKIGIIGAMEVEIATLKEKMTDLRESRYGDGDYYEGTLEGMAVVVSRCGVGKVNAAMCAQILCDCFHVTHIINTGIAGALRDDLKILDMVISQDAIYHDVDATGFGYAPCQIPGTKQPEFSADETLTAYAFAAADAVNPGHTRLGRVASGDQFVNNSALKEAIASKTKGLCTEMEGAAIAQVCTKNEIPFVIIRAISDAADESVSWEYFEKTAAEHCARVTCDVVRRLADSMEA